MKVSSILLKRDSLTEHSYSESTHPNLHILFLNGVGIVNWTSEGQKESIAYPVNKYEFHYSAKEL